MRATAARSTRLAPVEALTALSFLLVTVVIEVLFFVVLVSLLPSYAHELHVGKVGAGVLSASLRDRLRRSSLPAGAPIPAFGARRLTTSGVAIVGLACAVFHSATTPHCSTVPERSRCRGPAASSPASRSRASDSLSPAST